MQYIEELSSKSLELHFVIGTGVLAYQVEPYHTDCQYIYCSFGLVTIPRITISCDLIGCNYLSLLANALISAHL